MGHTFSKVVVEQAQALLEQLDIHIKMYLVKLQDVEAGIVNADLDIASGNYGCHHYRPRSFFNAFHPYSPYTKIPIEYTIEGCTDVGIKVDFYGTQVLIPYEFSPESFKVHCDELFAQAREDMARCVEVKSDWVEKEKKNKAVDKRIRSEHVHDGYVYRWEECTRCQMGYVYIGTGEWEDDPFDQSEDGGQREITRREYCPVCNGSEGVLVYSKDHHGERTIACGKERFISNEGDLMALMAGY